MKNELINLGELQLHDEMNGGSRTAMIPDEVLLKTLAIDTTGDTEKVRRFVEELAEEGKLMTEGDVTALVEKARDALQQPTGRMTIDSLGHLDTRPASVYLTPSPTYKERRAEKARKKREAKFKRSQYAREMGML
ncbi:hypothetical protein pEaSNUABM11_00098 [Erwinia phage pEa_SNUABM_11]|nr:hypothetical protein pEaSNUABM11_00098 [Erwinia phage pEa_SNUABM_11]